MVIQKKEHYEAGDKVLIRSWDDMAREYGVYADGGIVPACFVTNMKKFCGKTLTIKNAMSNVEYFMKEDSTEFIFHINCIAGKVVDDSKTDTWIISIACSEANGVKLLQSFGTEHDIRNEIMRLIDEDRARDEDMFDCGTGSAEEIDNSDNELNAFANFETYHIDYTARRLDKIEKLL